MLISEEITCTEEMAKLLCSSHYYVINNLIGSVFVGMVERKRIVIHKRIARFIGQDDIRQFIKSIELNLNNKD